MRGKPTIRRILLRWRITLGRISAAHFAALLLALSCLLNAPALLSAAPGPGMEIPGPGHASLAVRLSTVVLVSLFETLVAQGAVVWLVRKALPGSFLWPVLFSTAVFGTTRHANPIYLPCLLAVGAVLAFGYLSRLECRGFNRAFWPVATVHVLNNMMLLLL